MSNIELLARGRSKLTMGLPLAALLSLTLIPFAFSPLNSATAQESANTLAVDLMIEDDCLDAR